MGLKRLATISAVSIVVLAVVIALILVITPGRREVKPATPEAMAATLALVNMRDAMNVAVIEFSEDPEFGEMDVATVCWELGEGVMTEAHRKLLTAWEDAGFFECVQAAASAESLASATASMSLMTDRWEVDPNGNRSFEPSKLMTHGEARQLVRALGGSFGAAEDDDRRVACFAAGMRLAESQDASRDDLARLTAPAVLALMLSHLREQLLSGPIDVETGQRFDQAIGSVADRSWVRMYGVGVMTRTELLGARLHLAMERYRAAHDTLPTSLDDLVPEFLDALPQDPASSGAFRYTLLDEPDELGRDYLVYSVGLDKQDNGGRVKADARNIALRGMDKEDRREGKGYDFVVNLPE